MNKARIVLYAAATVALAVYAIPAKADLIPATAGDCSTVTPNCGQFIDIGAQGFGNAPRILTEQTNGSEAGSVAPNGSGGTVFTGDAISNGNFKGSSPSVVGLGWQQGSNVGILFNSDQIGQSGIGLAAMTLTLFNGANPIGSFSLASGINYSAADLALEPGNGNAGFRFVLNGAEQITWNALITANAASLAALAIGLSASLTGTNDGPDSFRAIATPNSPIGSVPIPGAAWLFGTGLAGIVLAGRKRKQKTSMA